MSFAAVTAPPPGLSLAEQAAWWHDCFMEKRRRDAVAYPAFKADLDEKIAEAEAFERENPEETQRQVERAQRAAAKWKRREARRLTIADYARQLKVQAQRQRIAQRIAQRAVPHAPDARTTCSPRPRGHRSARRACARSPGRKAEEPEPPLTRRSPA